LGLGVLTSVAPASAAASYTASMTVPTSLTVVGANSQATWGFFKIDLVDDAGNPTPGFSGETLTIRVVTKAAGVDTTTATSDLAFESVVRSDSTTALTVPGGSWSFMADTTTSSSLLTANQGWASKTAVDTALRGSYWFAVQPRLANAAVDQGAYTVEAALTDATGLVTKKTFPVSFVSSLAYLTGATVTNSISGTFNTGSALTVGTTYVKSTLKDSAGGHVVIAKRDPATSGYLPTLKARLLDSTGVQVQANTTFNVSDTGTSGYDLYQATPDSATAWTSWGDGVYGVNTVSTITAAAPTDGTSLQMEVTLNGTTSRDTDNITIVGSQSGYGTATVSGTGIIDSASTAGT